MDRMLVVVPTYDERDNIEELLDRVLAVDPRLAVLVVDDASPDGTGELVAKMAAGDDRVRLLRRPGKHGLGSAYKAGFRYGLEGGWNALCQMDADLSHDPADLARLLAALDDGADLAVGSRYVPGGGVAGWPAHRRLLSVAGNRYVRLVTGCPVRDATGGFRAFRRPVLANLPLDGVRSEGYAFQVEMLLRCWRAGYRIEEVPITFTDRVAGVSKIDRRIIVEAVWRTLGWGWNIRVNGTLTASGRRA